MSYQWGYSPRHLSDLLSTRSRSEVIESRRRLPFTSVSDQELIFTIACTSMLAESKVRVPSSPMGEFDFTARSSR